MGLFQDSFGGPFILERFAKLNVYMCLNSFIMFWLHVYFISLVENFSKLLAGFKTSDFLI